MAAYFSETLFRSIENMHRQQKLLTRIDKSMKVLEIGPSFSPIVPKSEGWNAWSVDHTDQAGLREKYLNNPTVDINRIGPVDFVWASGDLDAAVPVEHHRTFDACIASHVIEHIPNLVGFYQSLGKLIRPSGIVVLAVPDKRFCFDYFRPLSMTSDFILAHSLNRRRHSKKTTFDHTAYTVSSDGTAAWGQHPVGDLSFYGTLTAAYDLLATTDEAESAPYVDYHAWCYTPSSFKLVMLELNVLRLIDWVIDQDFPAEGCEFIVVLKKGRLSFPSEAALQEVRRALLKGMLADLAVQCGYMDAATSAALERPSLAVPCGEDTREKIAALEQQQQALAERLQRQETRLAKIWETSKLMRKILRPVRAVASATRGARARPR